MYFNRNQKDKEFCVYGLMETYNENDPHHSDDWEPWALSTEFYGQIIEYYKEHPHQNIDIVELEKNPNEETENE